ncbi:Kazal-type serine protease inhibitor domain protein, partial [Cooperia oncophora]
MTITESPANFCTLGFQKVVPHWSAIMEQNVWKLERTSRIVYGSNNPLVMGPGCICVLPVANMSVCGSDGTTYDSMCQLIQFACKHQLDLVAVSLGICSDDSSEPRERNNREKDTPSLKHLPPCTSNSDCEAIGAVCEPIDAFSSMCKCSEGEIFLRGQLQS